MKRVLAAIALASALASCKPQDTELDLPQPATWARRDPWGPIRAGVRHLVLDADGPDGILLRRVYRERGYRTIWVSPSGLTQDGRVLLLRLIDAEQDGLRPSDYDIVEIGHLVRLAFPREGDPLPHRIALLEWALSKAFIDYARQLLHGRTIFARDGQEWHLEDDSSVDLARIAVEIDAVGAREALSKLADSHESYTSLRAALRKYRRIRDGGGWPRLPRDTAFALGERSEHVVTLRRRLFAEGDASTATGGDLFDPEMEEAVARFQKRHGLAADGKVGPRTLEALNVSAEERVRQLEINLERRRWMPETLGERFLLVNVPEYRLYGYRGGRVVLDMPVVVGSPWNRTPSFSDRVRYVVLNPYWNVPSSIVAEELLPRFREDSGYLARADFEVLGPDGAPVAISDLEADEILSRDLRVRKRPGRWNDLGRIKFMFPNRFNIYLHDTPARHLFDRPRRASSHGCIRVGEPLSLGRYVLGDEWTEEEIEEAIQTSRNRTLPLAEDARIPVHIVYLTAWMDAEGDVHFRDDIYGRDEALAAAFASRGERIDFLPAWEWHSTRLD